VAVAPVDWACNAIPPPPPPVPARSTLAGARRDASRPSCLSHRFPLRWQEHRDGAASRTHHAAQPPRAAAVSPRPARCPTRPHSPLPPPVRAPKAAARAPGPPPEHLPSPPPSPAPPPIPAPAPAPAATKPAPLFPAQPLPAPHPPPSSGLLFEALTSDFSASTIRRPARPPEAPRTPLRWPPQVLKMTVRQLRRLPGHTHRRPPRAAALASIIDPGEEFWWRRDSSSPSISPPRPGMVYRMDGPYWRTLRRPTPPRGTSEVTADPALVSQRHLTTERFPGRCR